MRQLESLLLALQIRLANRVGMRGSSLGARHVSRHIHALAVCRNDEPSSRNFSPPPRSHSSFETILHMYAYVMQRPLSFLAAMDMYAWVMKPVMVLLRRYPLPRQHP